MNKKFPLLEGLVKTPKRLELHLSDEGLTLISPNSLDSELLAIDKDARRADINYVLSAKSLPTMNNRQTADELASILNQAYQSPLYQDREEFRGKIVYKEMGRYISRD